VHTPADENLSTQAPYSSESYTPPAAIRWGLPEAVAVIALTAVAEFGLSVLVRGMSPDVGYPLAFIGDLVGYGCTLLVILFASRHRGLRRLATDFGFTFQRRDLRTGAAIAAGMFILIQIISAILRTSGALPPPLPPEQRPLIWEILLSGVIGVAVAPFIEELTLRGVLLRSIRNSILRRRPANQKTAQLAINTSIVISAAVFAALHLHEARDLSSGVTLGAETFIFGLITGFVATRTGRLGPTIAAHLFYNAIVFAIMIAARR
jgi:membrane protease YdiL (CAAX protease family)